MVCGPTGAGKTKFAIELAQRINGEIVGADSMQIFRYMDIGTAKPTLAEQAAAPHHLIDIADPDMPFDAASYIKTADRAVKTIVEKNKVPLIVGGTGLYIKALTLGLFQAPSIPPEIRQKLKNDARVHGNRYLHQYLERVDPASAGRINVNDTQRLLRALEIFEANGIPISHTQKAHGFKAPRYHTLKIGLKIAREQLYQRIDLRVDEMIEEGLLEEVRKLIEMGFAAESKPMQALGYRHMVEFINNKLSWEEAVRTLKRDHRRYAKRQMTWFRADPDVHWIEPHQTQKAVALALDFFSPDKKK